MPDKDTGGAVAIIPARGGSKRIPRKNIRPFHGRPMIHWPLTAARDSNLFSRIIVSTDDAEIAEIAREEGAETPFMRDKNLADDMTGTKEVISDAIRRLNVAPGVPVCCLYATAAFIHAGNLRAGLEALFEDQANWIISVAEYDLPIRRAYEMNADKLLPIFPEFMPKRSQDLPPAYFDAGQFYWAKAVHWASRDSQIWDRARPVILNSNQVVDIDTLKDWERAERIFVERNAN